MKANQQLDDRKFLLKPGTLLHLPGTSIDYNNSNLTDQIAKNILTKSPGSRKFFEKVDEEFMAQLQKPAEPSSFKEPVTITQPKQEQSKVIADFKAFLENNLPGTAQESAVEIGLVKYNTILKVIANSESVEHITELAKNDPRAGVQKAAAKRIEALTKPS